MVIFLALAHAWRARYIVEARVSLKGDLWSPTKKREKMLENYQAQKTGFKAIEELEVLL